MNNVAQLLNIATDKTEVAVYENKNEIVESETDNDLKFARNNYYEIINQGRDALDGALRVASLSDHPRAYEVVGSLLKNLADVNKQLIELASLQKNNEVKEAPVQTITNNVQFIGTNADLNKLIADRLKEQ